MLAASLHSFITVSETYAVDDNGLLPGTSKIKGLPHLPPDFIWPVGALFLAQFNLAELAPQDILQRLPAAGMLYFFSTPILPSELCSTTPEPWENSSSGHIRKAV
ncbi:DUF1963 domain-containing protein [Chitinophaga pollutisoli]|uniref:DUF1963 domain-containing protein n=1 Tax=Chitinophaga pollutisoli TaxID=3133966 RepID=UPI0038573937